MKYIKTLLFCLIFYSVSSSANHCNECDLSHRWWWNLGVGVGSTFNSDSSAKGKVASQISFNGMLGSNLFLTYEHTQAGSDSWDKAWDTGILLGYKNKHPNWYWSAGAGVSYYEVSSPAINWWGYREKHGVGMPVQGQLFWTLFKHFGVGLIGHAVVSKDPYAAALLAIQIF